MRTTALSTAAAMLLFAVPTFAQSMKDTAPRTTTTPAAVANPNDTAKTTAAPVAGKNSFTEAQTLKRLQDQGYSNVTGLMQDSQSVWHGKAVMSGKPVEVAVDYQGNITTR
jgi:hypothetical protein